MLLMNENVENVILVHEFTIVDHYSFPSMQFFTFTLFSTVYTGVIYLFIFKDKIISSFTLDDKVQSNS